ncbi:YhgE/Pip domain-containing protein [Clostridium tertium]|uniref:YhgE/Pip domain-containing protein n=1 Tax=Clostridium tertium TaxID=1559 RepID=UPI002330074C|nr:YhgE/Pip domain-containing protein [Clostridium tertium]MDB1922894.1 YhgE/Pip domain-containing protein [Clostridium tertium]MDB1927786.1 YhgE/Pip domain-containing protein [Clostridium tertium]MDB1929131.1 YhgE/Pip domain-containing protein [Clostridium tertium]
MKNIFRIFSKDIKSITTNWVALVIIVGLMILPSLYAWFNIRASWDPYGNTGGIKVAIVNKDRGGSLKDKTLNVGDELVNKLKENSSLGWNFVSEEEGNQGVEKGRYYATIVIPENFTEETLSIMGKEIKRPTLMYKVNQKSNAIAPKITDKGVTTIKSQVDTNIIETVDGTIFKILNEAGVSLEGSRDKILRLINGVISINSRMPEIENIINQAYDGSAKADDLVNKVKDNLPLLQDTLNTSNDLLADTKNALEKSKEGLKEVAPVIRDDLEFINNALSGVEDAIDGLMNINIDKDAIIKGLDNVSVHITEVNDKISNIIKVLDPISKFSDNLKAVINDLNLASSKLQSINSIIKDIQNLVSNNKPIDKNRLQQIKDLVTSNKNIITNILNNYDSQYIPAINKAIDQMNIIADNSIKLVGEATSSIPDIASLLEKLDKGLKVGREDIGKLKEEMPTIKSSLANISSKLSSINNEEEINKILSLLKNDWQAISEFLGSPVEIKEEILFSIPNYGSAMSPFYSTLALWVGALILVSLLTTNPHGFNEEVNFKPYEKYFGKFLTFAFIGICQSLILSLGDIYLLKCYVLNKWLFIGISILSSLVFILIVYTLVSIFGNVGKAIAVILLVIQVAGAGGTFPVEVMPSFFKKVNPFLPFTYSISAMREAVAGIVKSNLTRDITMIVIYGVISIIIGLFLKGPINKISKKFIDKLNESGLVGH